MTLNDKTYKIPPYGRVNFMCTAFNPCCRSLLLYTVIRPIPVPTRLHHQRPIHLHWDCDHRGLL